jgi:PAS domain S-box
MGKETHEASRPQSERNILLVEDEHIIAMAERLALEREGFSVRCADTGEEAIEMVASGPRPDLILMDIDLGSGMDGTEAARRILSRWELPIVFLTSHSSRDMVERVRGITRYGYVVKHSGDFVMVSSIEMAFELFRKERALRERERFLERAEEVAGIGSWYVLPGEESIRLSEGAKRILGVDAESLMFGDIEARVLPEGGPERRAAFAELIAAGRPYDSSYRYRRPDSGKVVTVRSSGRNYGGLALGVIQDISELRRLGASAYEAECRRAVTLQSIGDGVISTDREGRVIDLNPIAERLTGWSCAEALGKHIVEIFEIVNAFTRESVENPIRKVMESGGIVGLANHTILIARDRSERHIADSAAPIKSPEGEVLGMVLIFRDVTDERLAQVALAEHERLFRGLFVGSHQAMLLIDPESCRIVEANEAAALFYGWSVEELKRMSITDINTLDPRRTREAMARTIMREQAEFSFVHRDASGQARAVLVRSGPVDVDGRRLLLSIVSDLGEIDRKRVAAEELERNSALAVRDARHRAKNVIAQMASMINIQAECSGDEAIREAFDDLRRRIDGISVLFELLYDHDESTAMSAAYLERLLDLLRASLLPPGIELAAELCDAELPRQTIATLGMIVNELVANCCKHAFPRGGSGRIEVRLERAKDGRLELSVADDGMGMGKGAKAQAACEGGLGLVLVKSLAEQAKAELEILSGTGGTRVIMRFDASPTGRSAKASGKADAGQASSAQLL